jgi:hypothetical protein
MMKLKTKFYDQSKKDLMTKKGEKYLHEQHRKKDYMFCLTINLGTLFSIFYKQ